MKRSFFAILILILLFAMIGVNQRQWPAAFAQGGGRWVSSDQQYWRVERICPDGVVVQVLSNESGDEPPPPDILFISLPITPRLFTEPLPSLNVDPEGIYSGSFESNAYFPKLAGRQTIFEDEIATTPLMADINGDGMSRPYYLYTTGIIRWSQPLPSGALIMLDAGGGRAIYEVSASCSDPLSQTAVEGNTPIDNALISKGYPFDPALLQYELLTAPSQGDLILNGGTLLTAGARFTQADLDLGGVEFAPTGGEIGMIDQARFSASGTMRVSTQTGGEQAVGGTSLDPSISADGAMIAFSSSATNLLPDGLDSNGVRDIFVYDTFFNRLNGATVNTSYVANGPSGKPALDPFGYAVLFGSDATNLVFSEVGCSNSDIFEVDLRSSFSRPSRLSQFQAEGACSSRTTDSINGTLSEYKLPPDTTAYYAYAFQTLGDLTGQISNVEDLNGQSDVLVNPKSELLFPKTIADGGIVRPPFNRTPNGFSGSPAISPDGEHLVFESGSDEYVANDLNATDDIVIVSNLSAETQAYSLASVNSAGEQANSFSIAPSISRFGDYVTFASAATNLAEGTSGFTFQVYVRDRDTDRDGIYDEPESSCTTLVSKSNTGAIGDDANTSSTISADGRFIAFISRSGNLVEGDIPISAGGFVDVFVHDRDPDRDGSFYSPDPSDARCTPGPYRTFRVSVASDGTPANGNSSGRPDISDNGTFVAFSSAATNLVPDDTNGVADIFLHYIGHEGELTFVDQPPEPTATPTATVTATPPPPSATPTSTALPPTATATPLAPSPTVPSGTAEPPVGTREPDRFIYLPMIGFE